MALLNPHWQALTPATRDAFHLAASLPFIQRYYLAGGTGLALHLGHRFSVDLDFFSPAADTVGPDERAVLRTVFDDPSLSISHDKDMTFVATWRGVGVSFFRLALYPAPRVSGVGKRRQRLQVVLRQADVVAPAFHHQPQEAILAAQPVQG